MHQGDFCGIACRIMGRQPKQRDELDLFKSRINLGEYASAKGYVLDRQHSRRNSVAMRGPTGDKVGLQALTAVNLLLARFRNERHYRFYLVLLIKSIR